MSRGGDFGRFKSVGASGKLMEEVASCAPVFDFDALFRGYYPRIARVVARVVRDPARAEELAVDVFCKLWTRPDAQGESAEAWLYRSGVRAGLDELRRQQRRQRYERVLERFRGIRTPEQLHAATEEGQQVRAVLARLKRRDAGLLVLRSDGLSYDELSCALRIKRASVGTLLVRAQEAFRKDYVKHYGEPRYEA